jgi:hypothetical protein
MGTRSSMARKAARREDRPKAGTVRREELRAALDRTLRDLDDDHTRGPLLRATGVRMRLEFPDVGLVLNVAASEEPGRHLRWSFDPGVDWEPKLELTMDSETANGYLQGRESLAIAIARGRVRFRGDSRATVLFLPAVRLIVDPYKRVVSQDYPHLALS